jgi:hypothetical protein
MGLRLETYDFALVLVRARSACAEGRPHSAALCDNVHGGEALVLARPMGLARAAAECLYSTD